MVRHTLKILHLLQDFQSVSDHFATLCFKGLILAIIKVLPLKKITGG